MWNGYPARVASLLPCLALAACMVTGEEAATTSSPAATPPASAAASPPAPATSAVASPAPTRWGGGGGGGGGARGGSTTAGARAEPVEVGPDFLTQARAACWMKVESQKGLRSSIDQRSAFVDKCVAEQLKSQPAQ